MPTTRLPSTSIKQVVPESKRLLVLERVIKRGRDTFVEVGSALAEIRDTRLYTIEYDTFEEYCREKWEWGKAYAYQLIGCAEVKKSPIGDSVKNQSQAKELARVEPEDRPRVIARAVETAKAEDRPMTAKDIKQAAMPEPEPEEKPHVVAHTEVMAKAASPPPPASSPDRSSVAQLRRDLDNVKAQIRELETKRNELQKQLRQAILASPSALECNQCLEVFEDDSEAVTLYECGECGSPFTEGNSSDGCSNRCPNCNKFAAKLSDRGCPDCGGGELVIPDVKQ